MVKIIETILSVTDNSIRDHQSRIIQATSWDEYISYYEKNKDSDREHSPFQSLTVLVGDTLPRYGDVTAFDYDSFHSYCEIINPYGVKMIILAYLANY